MCGACSIVSRLLAGLRVDLLRMLGAWSRLREVREGLGVDCVW